MNKKIVSMSEEKYAEYFNIALQQILIKYGYNESEMIILNDKFQSANNLNEVFDLIKINGKTSSELYDETVKLMKTIFLKDNPHIQNESNLKKGELKLYG